jgi:hypothetical protein
MCTVTVDWRVTVVTHKEIILFQLLLLHEIILKWHKTVLKQCNNSVTTVGRQIDNSVTTVLQQCNNSLVLVLCYYILSVVLV